MKNIYQDILLLKKYVDERGGLKIGCEDIKIIDNQKTLIIIAKEIMIKELKEDIIEKFFNNNYYNHSFYYNLSNNSVDFYITSDDFHNNSERVEYSCKIPANKEVLEKVKKIYYSSAFEKAKTEVIEILTIQKLEEILSTKRLILEK